MRGIWNSSIAGEKVQDNRRTIALGHMNLERRMFDLVEYPFVGTRITLHVGNNAATEGCVREEASDRPHVTDVFVVHRLVELELIEFIRPHGTKNWIIFG